MNNNNGSFFNWKSFPHQNNYSSWNYKKINKNLRYSAGILPYTFDQNGKLLFLLGKDNDGDWSDFGGRCEVKDQNDPLCTASREFYEESLGAIMSIHECLPLMLDSKKIVSKTLNGSPYYMYLVYIDFLNYSDTFVKVSNFLKYQFETRLVTKLAEKVAIRWVNLDTLLNCIENKDSCTPIPLRGVFYKTINEFKEKLITLQR